MDITFGKYKGKLLEYVMIAKPDYISWLLKANASNKAMILLQAEAKSLVKIFDGKPFINKCQAHGRCTNPVTRCTVYEGNPTPYWWCADCDPHQHGAIVGKLKSVSKYREAISKAHLSFIDNLTDRTTIIRSFARAKGFPDGNVTAKRAQKFFESEAD